MISEINPEFFTYDNYESNYGSALDLSYCVYSKYPEYLDFELILALMQYAIGYCDASRLTIRPRSDFVAVMCEKDGERFWFHIMKKTLEKINNVLYEKINSKKNKETQK